MAFKVLRPVNALIIWWARSVFTEILEKAPNGGPSRHFHYFSWPVPVSLKSIMSAERHTEGKFALRGSKRFWGVKWTIKGERIWNLVQTGYKRLLKGQRNVERCWWWGVWPAAKFKNWLLNFFSFPRGESVKVDSHHRDLD